MPRALKSKKGKAGVTFTVDGPVHTEVIPHQDRMLLGDELARLIAEDDAANAAWKVKAKDARMLAKARKEQILKLALEVDTGTRQVSAQLDLVSDVPDSEALRKAVKDMAAAGGAFVLREDAAEAAAGDAAEPEPDEVGF